MSDFDWEKQNRKENIDPSYLADIARHARKRQTRADSLNKKAGRLIALERKLQDPYKYGIEVGEARERERIVKLLEPLAEHEDYCKDGCYLDDCVAWNYEFAIALIKGEQNV